MALPPADRTTDAQRPFLADADTLKVIQGELPRYVARQRWYAGEGAAPEKLQLLAWMPLEFEGCDAAALAVWRATAPHAATMDLFIPVARVEAGAGAVPAEGLIATLPGGEAVIDALASDAFIRRLVRLMAAGDAAGDARAHGLEAQHTARLGPGPVGERTPVIRAHAEQSNTSVRIGDRMIIKCFRRLTAGVHPELEMSSFLSETARFESTPALLGWVNYRGSTIAILQSFVANEGDGWSWLTRRLAEGPAAADAIRVFIRNLAVRTAELHLALAAPSADPAFAPERADAEDWERWIRSLEALAIKVSSGLEQHPELDSGGDEFASRTFRHRLDRLRSWAEAFPASGVDVMKVRHHGDYHLGQVLVSSNEDVTIVDFEGEPLRPLAERRAKHIALRDVAGMLRSFYYATAFVEREAARADEGSAGDGLATTLRSWREQAVARFLVTYLSVMAEHGVKMDEAYASKVVRFFSIEKALYEVSYEMAHRPAWTPIAFSGLMAELDQIEEPASPSVSPRPWSPSELLARHCGILDGFVDARGERRGTTPETRAALLAAMGFRAGDEAAAAEALRHLLDREEQRALPPVHVHFATQGALELDVHGAVPPGSNWQLELEGGALRQGVLIDMSGQGVDTQEGTACRIRIDAPLPFGYHQLKLKGADATCTLIVTPGRCWLPADAELDGRLWGVSAQLYLLRSRSNWGIGDFGDLKGLLQGVAAKGADAVGVNPLHALFTDDPEQASPYSPASRLLLNVLNIDVGSVAATMGCPAARRHMGSAAFRQALSRAREVRQIDYSAVAALKLPVLGQLFECCDRNSPEWNAFLKFRAEAGESFERSCLFLALRSSFAQGPAGQADWHEWPDDYRRVDSPGTLRYAEDHAEAVTFQAWLQFIADRQLRACHESAEGMRVGLYRDLAIGAASAGAETWANQQAVIDGVHVGVPPDIYNPQGQDWGLPPFDPRALRDERYRSFIELLRANMRYAGGLRIDHVVGLKQLYWIPQGRPPCEGAYVRYPLEDLIGILALESHRHRCLVVGEDLGTVPAGFRERMESANILSYRLLYFEKTEQGFVEPEEYPRLSLAAASSHDLPTLRAWWTSEDLELKRRLKLFPTDALEAESRRERSQDREQLRRLLARLELLESSGIDRDAFVEAAHGLLARSRSILTMLQMDDLTAETSPVNVPTTSVEYPNWRRRQTVDLEDFLESDSFERAAKVLNAIR